MCIFLKAVIASNMKRIIIIWFFVFSFLARIPAQNPNYAKYGIGYLYSEKGLQTLSINFPNAEFELFDSPGGKKTGVIFKKDFINLMYKNEIKKTVFRVKNEDMVEFADKTYCLKYFEQSGDYLKILVNSTGKGYWISIKELKYLRIISQSWFDYFLEQKKGFYPAIDIGLNIREKPDVKSRKIALLKSDYYYIKLSGTTEGMWAEAEVIKYDTRPCKSKDPASLKAGSKISGWIKIIDDTGVPNIWFHCNGCE